MQTIFEFYSGYLHLIPRMIALPLSYLTPNIIPLSVASVIVILTSIAITSICFCMITSPKFKHIFPDIQLRRLALIALCFTPGLFEVLGNLANLHWVCSFFLLLLGIREENAKLSKSEIFFSFLCVFTSGESIALFPIFLIRALQKNKIEPNRLSCDLLILIFIIFAGIANCTSSISTEGLRTLPSLSEILSSFTLGIGNWIFLVPIFSFKLTSNIGKYVPYFFSLFFLFILSTSTFKLIKNKIHRMSFFLLLVYILSILSLMILVRGNGAVTFFAKKSIYPWPDVGRYAFILGPSGILFWSIFLANEQRKIKNTRLLTSFLCLYCIHGLFNDFWIHRYDETEINWQQLDSEISKQMTSNPLKKVYIPCAPAGWGFWI